jgi:pimeloyl-ACP methyl ester carboxylesterase
VPTVEIGGLLTQYETTGSGPPVLMFSPGGFDATASNWGTLGIYQRIQLVEHLARDYTCITFDRRESGGSGGRVERVSWRDYALQGQGLLNHLGIEQAHVIGGCAGCSTACALAAAGADRVRSLVLFWPAGGVKYRIKQQARFALHQSFVAEYGLGEVVALAAESGDSFNADPRLGPWATSIRTDSGFADKYVQLDPGRYEALIGGMARMLFDRDTVPGAEPEDLLGLDVPSLVIPGDDDSHATSAARYLAECLPRAEYWDVPVIDQTEATVPQRILTFLESVPG